jgi:hypothetical protein
MALIILEGLDRVGKTTVANLYAKKGYEIVHMSAPPKGQTSDLFLEEMANLVTSAASRDIILDRSYYGEAFIWPNIYTRSPLIDVDGIEALRELEESVGVQRILMHDSNSESHWKRCVENNEPLTKIQFVKARNLYYTMADQYGFVKKTLHDFSDSIKEETVDVENSNVESTKKILVESKTLHQVKLEKANAINDILSKRIIKSKGPIYDDLEKSVRLFLNNELSKLFGSAQQSANSFSEDEVQLLKFFCERLKQKEI